LSLIPDDLLARPLSQAILAFVDVETTGLHPDRGDRICEVALIRQEPGQPAREFVSFVDPEREISPDAFAVNKITPEMLAGAPRFPDLIEQIDALLSGAVIVAHNASFDLGFLRAEYIRCGRQLPAPTVIDTVLLARRHFHFASNSLGAVARNLGVSQSSDAHRALADCRTARRILAAIVLSIFEDLSPTVAGVIGLTGLPFVPVADLSALGDQELPPGMAEVIRQNREIKITYVAKGGQKSTRTIRVKQVVRLGRYMYLAAQCLMRDEERHFRVDRIVDWSAHVTEEKTA